MKHRLLYSLAVGAVASACGGPLTYKIAASPKAVGADGTLQATIHKDEHETKVVLNVEHLPPPSRVASDAKYFVVWGRRDANGTWQRVGNIAYSEGARSGVFKGSFPELEFDVEVSVERDDTVVSPSSDIILSQHVGPA